MTSRYELRLSGAGGHGLLLAGKIIAEAAVIYDGKTATQAQSYGPEARGGISKSDVVISDGDIDFPAATQLDCLLAMTLESLDAYARDLKPGATALVDSDLVDRVPKGDFRVVKAPIVATARDRIGRPITANLVAVGIIAGLLDILSTPALESAVRARVPRPRDVGASAGASRVPRGLSRGEGEGGGPRGTHRRLLLLRAGVRRAGTHRRGRDGRRRAGLAALDRGSLPRPGERRVRARELALRRSRERGAARGEPPGHPRGEP